MLLLHLGNNFLLETRENNSVSLRSWRGSTTRPSRAGAHGRWRKQRGAAAEDEWCWPKLGIRESCLFSASQLGQDTHRSADTLVHTHWFIIYFPADVCFCSRYSFASSRLTVLYSFHVLWKSTLPSSLRWMTVHPPPALSMLQYTYTTDIKNEQGGMGPH